MKAHLTKDRSTDASERFAEAVPPWQSVVSRGKDQRTAATLSIRRWTTYSADSWDAVERQRWAADLAAAEAPDRALKLHRGRPVIDRNDRRVRAVQILRADGVIDPDDIPDAELRERSR
jgi:hypothetical protein